MSDVDSATNKVPSSFGDANIRILNVKTPIDNVMMSPNMYTWKY